MSKTIFSWNINGIRAGIKKGAFFEFFNEFDPDIVCLQETKAMRGQTEIDLPTYLEYWNSAEKKGYSGTAVFTKEKPLDVTAGFQSTNSVKLIADKYGDPVKEGRLLTVEYDEFFLCNVYTPNSKGDLSRLGLRQKAWDPAFLNHVTELEKKKPVILCGDLNVAHQEIDLARPKENVGKHGFTKEEREGFQKLIDHGFIDAFRIFNQEGGNYTWWTHWANARARNVGWRIDYFLVSRKIKDKIKSANIHPEVMGSDHCPISIEVDL
jgi:exodeoxyribonuclease III